MQLFFLYPVESPKKNARAYCDAHVVKIPLECTQMLFAAWNILEGDVTPEMASKVPMRKDGETRKYKTMGKGHINHPMSRWARMSGAHYLWAAKLGVELCKEYLFRYPKKDGKRHACHPLLEMFVENVPPSLLNTIDMPVLDPPLCFGDFRVPEDTDYVSAFRMCYTSVKMTQKWFRYKVETRKPRFVRSAENKKRKRSPYFGKMEEEEKSVVVPAFVAKRRRKRHA